MRLHPRTKEAIVYVLKDLLEVVIAPFAIMGAIVGGILTLLFT